MIRATTRIAEQKNAGRAPGESPLAFGRVVGYIGPSMKYLRLIFVAMAAVLGLTGCLQVEKVVKLQPDGSGTIEETVVLSKSALAGLEQMAGGGQGGGKMKA